MKVNLTQCKPKRQTWRTELELHWFLTLGWFEDDRSVSSSSGLRLLFLLLRLALQYNADLRFFNGLLSCKWPLFPNCNFSFINVCLYTIPTNFPPGKRLPRAQWVEGRIGTRTSLGVKKNSWTCRKSNPGLSIP